jgi:hypothetical protein
MIRTVKFLLQRIPCSLLVFTILLAVLQPCPNPVGARVFVDAEMVHLFSFTHPSGTYVFGLEPCLENTIKHGQVICGTNNKAASWWRINDDPGTGFTPAVREAKMSNEYKAVTSFTLNKHPYIFGLHKAKGDYNEYLARQRRCERLRTQTIQGQNVHELRPCRILPAQRPALHPRTA